MKAKTATMVARTLHAPGIPQPALSVSNDRVPVIERRKLDNPELSAGQRASDAPLAMNGDVAFLTLAGYIETASSLVVILKFLDLRARASRRE